MTDSDPRQIAAVVDYYDEHARTLFDRYQSVAFEDVHGDLLPYLPAAGGSCLDIGAGSGRDAAYLAQRGFQVTAIEPSAAMRRLALAAHAGLPIRWIEDLLPPLTSLRRNRSSRFEFILVSAIWMHIPPKRREETMRILRELIAPSGVVIISVRSTDQEDERIFFPNSAGEVPTLADRCGLSASLIPTSASDVHGRDDVHWIKFALTPIVSHR